MRNMLLALAAVLLAVDGYVHGLWTNRWRSSQELNQAAAQVQAVPMVIGDWQGQARALTPHQVEQAGFAAYLLRRYEKKDGSAVDVLLACGPPGPLSVHTPEVCFVGAGYEKAEESAPEGFEAKGLDGRAVFAKGKYEKTQGLAPVRLRVLWAWHAPEGWHVPANPRLTFAGLPVIHKLYVTGVLDDNHDADANCTEFMKALLPELDKALFAPR